MSLSCDTVLANLRSKDVHLNEGMTQKTLGTKKQGIRVDAKVILGCQ